MGRNKNVIPSVHLHIRLPEPIYNRLTLELWSDVEGRVPTGAIAERFVMLLQRAWEESRRDYSEALGAPAGTHTITTTPFTHDALASHLGVNHES